jgi:hypothetical protein
MPAEGLQDRKERRDWREEFPLLSPLPVLQPPCWHFLMWCYLYCVFTYIHSVLIEKDIFDRLNISNKFPCVCVYFHPEISSFFEKSFPFLSPFFVLSVLWYFCFHIICGTVICTEDNCNL